MRWLFPILLSVVGLTSAVASPLENRTETRSGGAKRQVQVAQAAEAVDLCRDIFGYSGKVFLPQHPEADSLGCAPVQQVTETSVLSGCGTRDALCVANRLLSQMKELADRRKRRRLDKLIERLDRKCRSRPRDVTCSGEVVSRGITVVLGGNAKKPKPKPSPQPRQPSIRPMTGLTCLSVPGYRGHFPARIEDNYHFGANGFPLRPYVQSCEYAVQNWNPEYKLVCVNHGQNRFIPLHTNDASTFGIGMRSLSDCVTALKQIRNGAICTVASPRNEYQIMDIRSRSAVGGLYRSAGQCIAALGRLHRLRR